MNSPISDTSETSFDIRSLSGLPSEIVQEILRRVSCNDLLAFHRAFPEFRPSPSLICYTLLNTFPADSLLTDLISHHFELFGETSQHFPYKSYPAVVRILVKGSFVHLDLSDPSALIAAAENGDLETIKLLGRLGADIHSFDEVVFRTAARYGHLRLCKYLIEEEDCQVSALGNSALKSAVANNHFPIVRLLVDCGADIQAQDNFALRNAAENGRDKMVRYLVKKGADVHAANDYPLRWAIRNGHVNVLSTLLDIGVKPPRFVLKTAAATGSEAVLNTLGIKSTRPVRYHYFRDSLIKDANPVEQTA